jgi:hypothetical protein
MFNLYAVPTGGLGRVYWHRDDIEAMRKRKKQFSVWGDMSIRKCVNVRVDMGLRSLRSHSFDLF